MLNRFIIFVSIYLLIFCGVPDSLNSQITNKSLFIDSSKITNFSQVRNSSAIFINNGLPDNLNKGFNSIDTNVVCQNSNNFIGNLILVDELNVFDGTYLWGTPPYPLPAKEKVQSFIYWDKTSDIKVDDISVYDVYGFSVEGHERISIDKQEPNSGILKWDCSVVPSGVYLIYIKHGTKSWTLKVIVNR